MKNYSKSEQEKTLELQLDKLMEEYYALNRIKYDFSDTVNLNDFKKQISLNKQRATMKERIKILEAKIHITRIYNPSYQEWVKKREETSLKIEKLIAERKYDEAFKHCISGNPSLWKKVRMHQTLYEISKFGTGNI